MSTRRTFLSTASAAAGVLSTFGEDGLARAAAPLRARPRPRPEEVARDEDFWREIQQAFTVDRSLRQPEQRRRLAPRRASCRRR